MANLLYVTPELLRKLQGHPAYQFWMSFIQNFPIRHVPLEERTFHERKLKVEENCLYLTVDMKFVYCRDGLFSFLYESQDLSFRLSASNGVLHTPDSRQFTALIGKVAEVSSSTDVELVNTDQVYHAVFDSGLLVLPPAGRGTPPQDVAATPKAPVAKPEKRPRPAAPPAKKAEKKAVEEPAPSRVEGLVLGKYDPSMCEKLIQFRTSSKKSYSYLSEKFGVDIDAVKQICKIHTKQKAPRPPRPKPQKVVAEVSDELRQQIIQMKKVSKKSYAYLATRFKLPVGTIQNICAVRLKRPRRRKG